MSATVRDKGGGEPTGKVAPAAESWDPAPRSAGDNESGDGSNFPETKDNNERDRGEVFGNDLATQREGAAAAAAGDAPPPMIVESFGANGPTYPPVSTTAAKRRSSMAFEIARVERAGKSMPPANPQKAHRVWELSRPRYVERREQQHGPGSAGVEGAMRRIRVLPGQERRDAVPYGVWNTSWAQMGDFGLDVGMYFVTVVQLVGATLVYAALCVVAMVHFSSEGYSGQQAGVRPDLRGSAVCTSSKLVLAYMTNSLESDPVERNDCPLDSKQGYADMAGVLLLFMLLLLLGKAQQKAAEFADTQIHSAQPYTVKVSSPDPLADDPDRWRRLFAQFGHVSYITVARGNGSLLKAMARRRAAGRGLEGSTADIPEVVEAYRAVDAKDRPDQGSGGCVKAFFQQFGLFRDTSYWKRQLWAMHDQVECEIMRGMHDQGLPVVKVFITFESDLSQARCLSHMSRGILEAPEEQHMYTNPDGFKKSLRVMPASPASEVLYENLHVGPIQRCAAQLLTFALTVAVVVLAYVAASVLQASSGVWAVAVLITAVDVLLPPLVRLLCRLERHHNSVTHDLSVMNKLTLARWANLAGIPFVLNDRLGTLTAGNLELVATVLWLNAVVPPAVRLLDIRGRWSRNVLAKNEVVQSAMDAHFEGSRFYLSERYTDATKTVFACLAYAPVLPIAMWLCLLALALSYWADKFLFMTAWKTPNPPSNSGRLARLARRHLVLAVLAHCLVSLYYYAGWPFDGICRFEGGWIECSQEGTGIVEAKTQDWMTGPQQTLVDVFSALNVTWLVILLVFYYLQSIIRGISLVVKGAPRKLRSRRHMPFGQLTSRYQHEVDAYVPRINSSKQLLPLLACDLDLLEPETIPWQVDGHKGDSFEDHCLSSSRDMPRISRYQRARLFSLCVHYPPPAPFEAIGKNRASLKNEIDWFRRPPPPGLQESKVPEMSEVRTGPEHQQRRSMADIPGIIDPDYMSQHPQSQAPLDSNGNQPSIIRSIVSAEDEHVPMLPGGAQSSLVSTAIVGPDTTGVGPGAGEGVRTRGSEVEMGGRSAGSGGGGSSGGHTIEASAEGQAIEDSDGDGGTRRSAGSGMSGRSGRSQRYSLSRVQPGDEHEADDVFPADGEGIGAGGGDEYFQATAAVSLAAAAAADELDDLPPIRAGPSGVGDGDGEEEDDVGDMSLHEEVDYAFASIPTPLPALTTSASGRALVDGKAIERSDSSEGWVDQYTTNSMRMSKEELARVTQGLPPRGT